VLYSIGLPFGLDKLLEAVVIVALQLALLALSHGELFGDVVDGLLPKQLDARHYAPRT
jgi:hypothetical protein